MTMLNRAWLWCGLLSLCLLVSCSRGDDLSTGAETGAVGGSCYENDSCNMGLTCQNNTCVACADGLLHCTCTDDGGCASGECKDDLCVEDASCASGTADCTCLTGGVCASGLTCSPQDICKGCSSDTAGCPCDAGSCGDGLVCNAGTCERDPALDVRVLDTCYSPCRDDIRLNDGTLLRCSSEGLMRGCLPGTDCVAGSCVAGTAARSCEVEHDCPDFQTCVRGECRSTCEGNNDCSNGSACYRHVCRVECQGSSSECDDGMYCKLLDAQGGFCMPLSDQAGDEAQADGDPSEDLGEDVRDANLEISLAPDVLQLSPARPKGEVMLANTGEQAARFVVRKLSHTELRDGRQVTVERGDQVSPLSWISVGFSEDVEGGVDTDTADDLEARLGYNATGKLAIEVTGSAPLSWQGIIEVAPVDATSRQPTRRIRIRYASNPEGRWEGEVYYFSAFDTTGMDAWIESRPLGGEANLASIQENDSQLNNAFLRRWREFVRYNRWGEGGYMDLTQLQALLLATREESWRHQSVRNICPGDQDSNKDNDPICYLSGNSQGYTLYSENAQRYPVPFGVVEFPMAIHLAQQDTELEEGGEFDHYAGKIDTASAMHYDGDPRIDLAFAHDATECRGNDDGTRSCVVPLVGLHSFIVVPGRYRADPEAGCPNLGEAHYKKTTFPWLVPGFLEDAFWDEQAQEYKKDSCRGVDAPFEFDEERNARFAEANPIPDGLPRVREMELIDGALIDSDRMIIIFRERMDSLLIPDEPIYSYGYMVLKRSPVALESADYEGSNLEAPAEHQDALATYACGERFREFFPEVQGQPPTASDWADIEHWQVSRARRVAEMMLEGRDISQPGEAIPDQQLHWLCRGPNTTLRDLKIATDANNTDRTGPVVEDDGDTPSARVVGYFNNGSQNEQICPLGSELHFFTVRDLGRDALRQHPCNTSGTCHEVYEQWETGARRSDENLAPYSDVSNILFDPFWVCESVAGQQGVSIDCTDNRQSPTAGKTFYKPGEGGFHFQPLRQVVRAAFRYRTEFLGRDNTPLGFPPELCSEDLRQTPYCYDPELVEQARDRVDCLTAIYHHHRAEMWDFGESARDRDTVVNVRDYLTENFSHRIQYHPLGNPHLPPCNSGNEANCLPVEYMGFERLYAELLILLGDESYTQAFASRFDLAGIRNRAFDGVGFEGEEDGVDLSGGVGYQMFLLYQSHQYYELVLERFARLARAIGVTARDRRGEDEDGNLATERIGWSFLTQATVTIYFDRLLRASTQKARAWSEIAKHYQVLNRPELARKVIERAYVSTYLEMLIFARLLDGVVAASSQNERAQLELIQSQSALRYRMAVLDMRKVHDEITDELTVFGIAPDYIPIPVLGSFDANSFERLYDVANTQTGIAAEKEQIALASDRSSRTELASFRSELSDIRTNYEDQLGKLCGYVEGRDGTLYPALARYAHLFRDADTLSTEGRANLNMLYQDPCGRFGSGEVFEAEKQIVVQQFAYQQIEQNLENTLGSVDDEANRVKAYCGGGFDFRKDLKWKSLKGDITSINSVINGIKQTQLVTNAIYDGIQVFNNSQKSCTTLTLNAATAADPAGKIASGTIAATGCGVSVANAIIGGVHVASNFAFDTAILQEEIRKNKKAREQEIEEGIIEACQAAQIDAKPAINDLIGDIYTIQIQMLQSAQEVEVAVAKVKALRNEVRVLEAEYDEKSQLAIDAAAAANDPNTRIYRNDEIITADRTFNRAIRSAYKATRAFEYYTGASYADRDKLLLSRTVAYGDYGLEAYMAELDDAYIEFQEQFGTPDERVLIKSLREDIFFTQLYGADGEPSTQRVRDEQFEQLLTDRKLLDSDSYIVIPFALNLDETSPITYDHKVDHIRAEIVYAGRTDALARVYVRPAGTSVLRNQEGEPLFYRMPPQLAVVNPFFNGAFLESEAGDVTSDALEDSIFVSRRLRDRPLVNTQWELVINTVDEQVNEDILLDEIKDIRLYFYYTDFTNLPR